MQNPGSVPAELSLSFSGRLVRPAPSDVLTNYEKEVAYVDRYLGEVQGELERLGIAEETLWIVVSDHGEGLFRHDLLGHARYAYEDQLRVLWLMRGPGIPAGKTLAEGPALLMDVAPTLIEMLGLTAPDMEGRSWASCLGDGPCPEPVPWWAFGLDHEANRPTAMAGYRWPYKWIWRRGQGRSGYQLTADPWEADNLLAVPGPHHPDALKRLAESFQAERRALNELLKAAAPSNLTEEEEELLRSLGYLGGPER